MFFIKFMILTLTINFGVLCNDDNEEFAGDTEIRNSREYNPEIWRAVEGDKIDMSGWIPQDSSLVAVQENPVPKRRLRKRKRRPPHVSFGEETNSQERVNYFSRRRLRPFRLEQHQNVMEDMEQENNKRSASRRRIIPVYNAEEELDLEPQLEIITEKQNSINPLQASIRFEKTTGETIKLKAHEKIRDPFDALKEAEVKQRTPEQIKHTTTTPNLKALLKKSDGTISLSEILQQKNLSLAELLTGNAKAISALTSPPESTQSTKPSVLTEITKYYRVVPSERKKISNRVFEQIGETTEAISSKEILEAQRKRLALLHGRKENKVYLGMTRTYEIVTEPITEKRLFVPSHPKLYSTVSYQPLMIENTKRTPIITSTTIEYSTSKLTEENRHNKTESSNIVVPENSYPKVISKKLPMTSAKLMTKTTKIPVDTSKSHQVPPKPIRINLDEIFKNKISQESNKVEDEPLQITLNINLKKTSDDIEESSAEDEQMTSEITHGKLKTVTAREEILEMLKISTYRDKLSKILKERNMTLLELMEQRERGSSQLHLADIFHNKTREPEPIEEPHVGVINSGFLENLREQKSRNFKAEDIQKVPIILSKINNWSSTTEAQQEGTVHSEIPNTQGSEFGMNKSFNYSAILPFWKQFHPDMFSQFYEDENIKQLGEFHRIEEIDNSLSDITNDKLNVELKPKNYNLDEESFLDIPSGVKSALVASFAIVGLSLFMFLTILVIFRWTQKNKNKLNYTSSLSGCKIKSPILEMPHRSMLKSFVCETLGRRTNLYKSHLQSMSDVWDERKQKF